MYFRICSYFACKRIKRNDHSPPVCHSDTFPHKSNCHLNTNLRWGAFELLRCTPYPWMQLENLSYAVLLTPILHNIIDALIYEVNLSLFQRRGISIYRVSLLCAHPLCALDANNTVIRIQYQSTPFQHNVASLLSPCFFSTVLVAGTWWKFSSNIFVFRDTDLIFVSIY